MSAEAVDQSATMSVPNIIVTEPSPMVSNPSVSSVPVPEKFQPSPMVSNPSVSSVSVLEKLTSPQEYTGELHTSPGRTEATVSMPAEARSSPEREIGSTGEFSVAEDCNACVVPVPEVVPESEQADATTESSSDADVDEFRRRGCCNVSAAGCERSYECLWNILQNRYTLPFWFIALCLPLSAGIMGGLYMFDCPAAGSLPNMVFMIGISLMAVFTLRICIIIHRMTWLDENSRSVLQTMQLICLFLTALFFITENVSYWKMNSTTLQGEKDFCDPTFSTYVYWWNIATSVFMLLILAFPIA